MITVCQLNDHGKPLTSDWAALVDHVQRVGSDLVVLPAMPFSEGFPVLERFHARTWQRAVDRHARWAARLGELAPARVVGTRPLDSGNERFEEAFVYSAQLQGVHANSRGHLPWYRGAAPDFAPVAAGEVSLGFLIGAELWHSQECVRYGREGVQVLITPRVHSDPRPDAWLDAARDAARRSGAVSVSSVHVNGHPPGVGGWIVMPDGALLAQTDLKRPFLSIRVRLPNAKS